jgi:hypothetical protein
LAYFVRFFTKPCIPDRQKEKLRRRIIDRLRSVPRLFLLPWRQSEGCIPRDRRRGRASDYPSTNGSTLAMGFIGLRDAWVSGAGGAG